MNILLAYNHASWRQCGYYHEKYFRGLGHDVSLVDLESTPYWGDWKGRLPVYVPKGLPVSVSSLEKRFGKKFDLYVEFDGAGQYHLSGMRRAGVKTVLWSIDTHIAEKRKFQKAFRDDYDLIFACHKDYVEQFGGKGCFWLPLACDPEIQRGMDLPKIYDIVFVGNADPRVYPERVKLLEGLSRKFKTGVFHKVFKDDMARALNQGKMAFNKSFNGDLNFRVFEALSCGAFLLTDRVKNGLSDLFEDGKHLVLYDGQKDLEDKAGYYLAHEEERQRIAAAGQRETLAKHTLALRAQAIMERVKDIQ